MIRNRSGGALSSGILRVSANSLVAGQSAHTAIAALIIIVGVVCTGAFKFVEPIDKIPVTEAAAMAWRLYFILGDILACVTVGAASGCLTSAIVSNDWFTLAAMSVGMIVGMLVGLFGAMPFTPLFGSFEIMLPTSLSGMVAGMAIGMIDTVVGIDWMEAALAGAFLGFICLVGTYALNARLRGETK